jgi:hypothetical protein
MANAEKVQNGWQATAGLDMCTGEWISFCHE